MKRRTQLEGHVWLERLGNEEGDGSVRCQRDASVGTKAAITFLTREIGALLIFAKEEEGYSMRLLPRPARAGGPYLGGAILYRAESWASIPDAARLDIMTILGGLRTPMWTRREVERWVV